MWPGWLALACRSSAISYSSKIDVYPIQQDVQGIGQRRQSSDGQLARSHGRKMVELTGCGGSGDIDVPELQV